MTLDFASILALATSPTTAAVGAAVAGVFAAGPIKATPAALVAVGNRVKTWFAKTASAVEAAVVKEVKVVEHQAVMLSEEAVEAIVAKLRATEAKAVVLGEDAVAALLAKLPGLELKACALTDDAVNVLVQKLTAAVTVGEGSVQAIAARVRAEPTNLTDAALQAIADKLVALKP